MSKKGRGINRVDIIFHGIDPKDTVEKKNVKLINVTPTTGVMFVNLTDDKLVHTNSPFLEKLTEENNVIVDIIRSNTVFPIFNLRGTELSINIEKYAVAHIPNDIYHIELFKDGGYRLNHSSQLLKDSSLISHIEIKVAA